MKIKHYCLFEHLKSDNIEWNILRDDNSEDSYFIPFDKEGYIESLQRTNFAYYVHNIVNYCLLNNITKVISIGAGKCGLEYHLKSKSNLSIIVTDTSESISRIKLFNVFDDAFVLDIINSNINININENTLILLSRIDTEFSDIKFKFLFEKLENNNCKHICLIPANLLTFKIIISEFKVFVTGVLKRRKRVFCGYSRTKSEFIKAWSKYYEIVSYKKNMFFLNKK